jgi:signal transduction histidine kinase
VASDLGRILVVDDNEPGRYAIARTLRRAGYDVLEAPCAAEGHRLIEAHAPRLVLLDVQLPDMDGRDMCKRIKADPHTSSTIVLQISATFVRDEDMAEALDSGADASLAEPVDPTVLVATVRALLRARQAEDTLREALDRAEVARLAAESANRAKDEFLATISHELRSPLSAILTWATLLGTDRLDPSRTSVAVAAIERNARMQAKLIEDLLDMSRIVSGGIRLAMTAVSPVSMIEAAAEVVRPTAETKRVSLHLALERIEAAMAGDESRLQQAVGNLIANAIKFTPEGGRVDVGLERDGDVLRVSVRDTGMGIAPELLPFIFERFRQGDSSSTRREGGLGLGLAIVRHIAELHGGRVDAYSEGLDRGATFVLTLPIRSPADLQPTPRTQSDRVAGRLEGVRVLLVDDETDSRDATHAVLESAGAEVTATASAAEAFEKLGRTSFDVVVSDIAMPVEDGYSLLKRARRLGGEVATLPAIALTAYAGVEDQQRSREAGFLRHLAKPVHPGELVGTVARIALRSQS